ncbi:MAG: hypothetical protein ACI8PT_001371, partial [Gammaproteobacteria bacterium]
ALWDEVLHLGAPNRLAPRAPSLQAREPVVRALRDIGVQFPSHLSLVAFVAAYFGVLATVVALGRATRERVWPFALLSWVTTFVFTGLAWYVFGPLLFPARATAVATSVIEPYNASPYARIEHDVALYSVAGKPGRWAYGGGDPSFVPGEGVLGAQEPPDWIHEHAPNRGVIANDARPYLVHRYVGNDVIAFDFSGKVTQTRSGFDVQVNNFSSSAVERTWMFTEGRVFFVGAVAPGTVLSRQFRHDEGVLVRTSHSWGRVIERSDSPPRHAQLEEAMLGKVLAPRFPGAANEAILFGFTRSPIATRHERGHWLSIEHALVVTQLMVQRDADFIQLEMPALDLKSDEEL